MVRDPLAIDVHGTGGEPALVGRYLPHPRASDHARSMTLSLGPMRPVNRGLGSVRATVFARAITDARPEISIVAGRDRVRRGPPVPPEHIEALGKPAPVRVDR